jgi:hypothetical protein
VSRRERQRDSGDVSAADGGCEVVADRYQGQVILEAMERPMKIAPVILFLLIPSLASAPAVRAGVASTVHGRSVLAMAGSPLAAGTRLTLVTPDAPQKVQGAVVVRMVADADDMKVRTPGPYYEIASGDEGQPLPELAVVVLGGPPVNRVANAVSLHIDETLPDVRVRACRSMEGLHLTLWTGEPLKAPRVWHLYYYVGYDLQQTCQPGDTADGGRSH